MVIRGFHTLISHCRKILSRYSLGLLCLAIPIYLSTHISILNQPFIRGDLMSKVPVSVSVDDAHLAQIEQIAQQLSSSGMDVQQTLPSIGVISGSIETDQLNHLYQIEGVQNIESQQGYQLAPPSSPIQ
jgi:hypothetical protein